MIVVVGAVVGHEAGDALTLAELFHARGPAGRHAFTEALDDPHRTEHVHRIGPAGTLHHEGVEGFAAHVLVAVEDGLKFTAGVDIILLEHGVVPVLIHRVAQDERAHLAVVAVHGGGRASDPARAFDHLLAEVDEEAAVVGEGVGPEVETTKQGHGHEVALEADPNPKQAPQRVLGVIAQLRDVVRTDGFGRLLDGHAIDCNLTVHRCPPPSDACMSC